MCLTVLTENILKVEKKVLSLRDFWSDLPEFSMPQIAQTKSPTGDYPQSGSQNDKSKLLTYRPLCAYRF
jgi:hypothetical protein